MSDATDRVAAVRFFDADDPKCVHCGLPFKDQEGSYALDSAECPWCGGEPKSPLSYIDGKGQDGYVEIERYVDADDSEVTES